MKNWVKILYLLCIWLAQCFPVSETKSTNDAIISEEIFSCDYTRFEVQLERLNLQAKINHESQLRQQKELFGKLDRKLNDLSTKIEGIEEKLFDTIKINTENLKDFIRAESQPQVSERSLITIDIKDKLEKHEQLLNKIITNENDTRQLIKEIDMEDHTQTLSSTISDNVVSLQKMDEKLKAIEDNSIAKIDQMQFDHDIQQHLNVTEKYLKDDTPCLTTSNQSYPTSCADFDANCCTINKCLIKNHLYGPSPFFVACDSSVDGGDWTVIQRRINGSVDFYRDWLEYKHGFGDINAEFFMGLEKLHALTSTLKPVELLIQLQDFENVSKYAKYDDFQIGNETENFKLIKVGSYTGDAGDSLRPHVGYSFSTKDRNNDVSRASCAKHFTAAWWYHDCYSSNLNGKYYQHPTKFFNVKTNNGGIVWKSFKGFGYSLKSVQMLIRPRNLQTD